MAADRDRNVLAKAGRRNLTHSLFSFPAALALVLALSASPSRAQRTNSDSASVPTASNQQQSQLNSVPSMLSLAASVQIHIRTADYFSTEDDGNGSRFIGVLVQPVVADGLGGGASRPVHRRGHFNFR
jgi:hypothetical protein